MPDPVRVVFVDTAMLDREALHRLRTQCGEAMSFSAMSAADAGRPGATTAAVIVCDHPSAAFDALAGQPGSGNRELLIAWSREHGAAAAAAAIAAGAFDFASRHDATALEEAIVRAWRRRPAAAPVPTAPQLELLRTVPGIVWEADAATLQFTFVSDHAERVLGYPSARWLEEPEFWRQHLHQDDRDRTVAACLASTQDGADHELDFRMIAADGRVVWLRNVVRVLAGVRRPALLRGVMIDITASVAREAALRSLRDEQAAVLEMIATDSPLSATLDRLLRAIEAQDPRLRTSILLLDPDTRRLRSVAAPSLSDSLIDAIDGLRIGPDAGSCGAAAYRERPVMVADTGTSPLFREFQDLCDHHEVRSSWSIPIFDAHQEVLGTFAVYGRELGRPGPEQLQLIDAIAHTAAICISRHRAAWALRDSEESARLLVETAIDAAITIDDRGNIVQWNREAERMFGWRREYAIGRPVGELVIPAAGRAGLAAALHGDDVQAGMVGGRTERTAVRADGSEFPIEISVSALRRGNRTLFHAFARDLTAQHRAAATRASLEAQLRQSQKLEAIGTLAGGIAHDFNNILAAIVGNVERLQEGLAAGDPNQPAVQSIQAAAQRAATLVRQILTFSRSAPPDRQVLSLAEVVADACALLRSTLPANVEMTLRLASDCPPVLADRTQIHQVVVNLCTNSWHAFDAGPGHIEVALGAFAVAAGKVAETPTLPPGHHVALTISDNGPGMSAEVRDRMFEPFFTTKQIDQGTGLGLAIVHGIVTAHDGTIEVDSAPGAGTAITMTFPAVLAEPPSLLPAQAPMPRGNGQRILYVDDEPALAALAATVLERLHYRAATFTSATAALTAFRQDPDAFAAVVTDSSMPEMSGLEFAAAVQRLRPDLPVVLISGYLGTEVAAKAKQLGVRHFLAKPNSMRDLAQVLHAAIAGDATGTLAQQA